MGWEVVWGLLILLLIFLSVLLIRAIRFRPYPLPEPLPGEVTVPAEQAASHLAAMIRCKTVSYREEMLIEWEEFDRFQALLPECFPLVHKACTCKKIGKTGLLYHWQGRTDKEPAVLMAHYDVVPALAEHWEKPPFAGVIEEGLLWGRGTLDTKATLCGILEAAEYLLSQGFVPERDFYFSFSGDEEIDGPSCGEMVSWFAERGIRPGVVVDEGGAVVSEVFPGVPVSCALVGIGEKGVANVECRMKNQGGHASTPPVHTLLGHLSQAAVNLENHPFPAVFTRPVAEMFDTLGRHAALGYRLLFANLWCFWPVLKLVCRRAGGELNAMVRTTCAATRMEGSRAFNVLPAEAALGLNLRLMGGTTIDRALGYLKKVIANDRIEIRLIDGTEPSLYSDTACAEWHTLTRVIHTTWPEVLISPYLMMACSDSRHYCRITDRVYRFSAMKLSREERAMIHGHNERIPLETLKQTVEFYIRLMRAY